MQSWRLERCQTAFHDFRVAQEALGKAQELENARIAAQRAKSTQEALDAKDKAISDLSRRYAAARMRNNPGPGSVPTLSAAAPLIGSCPDNALLARRLADLEGRILALLEAGDIEIAKQKALWEWATKSR